MKVKVLVLRTAGTNCDYETEYAFQLAGAETERVHINRLIARDKLLSDYHILTLPGGFSYGDDIAAGKLLANELKYKIRDQVEDFVNAGKLIIGICNGFQVLVKAGLLPGFNGISDSQDVTLYLNDSTKFECRWVYLQTEDSPCIFTKNLTSRIYLPVAHAEGKFTATGEILGMLEKNRQVVFRYVAENGKIAGYPWNPNSSDRNIAGICDVTGRILGLMPHPERYLSRYNHPRWTREKLPEEGDGLVIFRNAVRYAEEQILGKGAKA